MLEGAKLAICCGAGGVGKTSSAAALAMSAVERGQRVVVITIDPARRLAQALGIGLSNDPTEVPLTQGTGSLHALMLDPKATFDEMVSRIISTDALRRTLRDNHIYRVLTQAIAGMQEMMAVERLFELLHDQRFDLVVLDTPPTTNVLQFFEAPQRMARFFDRRVVKWFLPAGRFSMHSAVMLLVGKVAGPDLAKDLQDFFSAMANISETLAARATDLGVLLKQTSTQYIVVTGPEQSRIDETLSILDQLHSRAYTPTAIIVNRVTPEHLIGAGEESSSGLLGRLDAQRAEFTLRASSERVQIARLRERLGTAIIRVVPRLDVPLDSASGLHVLAHALGQAPSA